MIAYDETTRSFSLSTPNTSYVFRILENGAPAQLYWGRRLRTGDLSYLFSPRDRAFSPNLSDDAARTMSPDIVPSEYPVSGLGDFHSPALHFEDADGSRACDLRYLRHAVRRGKPPLPGLPSLSGENAETLEVTLSDKLTGVEVTLSYNVWDDMDVIARHASVVNHSGRAVTLDKAMSLSVSLPDSRYELLELTGAWARERSVERTPLRHGMQAVESSRGASGHQLNPFAALVRPETTEDAGEAYAVSLVYSGSFQISTEVDQFDTTRLQAGINPFDFAWRLEPGETFVTPEALILYSAAGLGGMSRSFHYACRRYLGVQRDRTLKRPVVLNVWEAAYFDFDAEKLKRIIRGAAGLGIDTFVLDDGWFGHRNNDRTSLGDWAANPKKLPGGLGEIADCCKENGMRFGLWFEPEMVSEDSDLYRAHPDWCLHVKGRPHSTGRGQLVLDFSRPDVRGHVVEAVSAVLSSCGIGYVKWDMNRNITNVGSAALPPERQREVCHRYILGVYEVMGRLTEAFPQVFFEGCAGGGGRFDFGVLYYMPQIWASDDTDAVARLGIQYGTSLVYPPECMSAHVSVCPNHQTGRTTPFATRGAVAMGAGFGYELDPLRLSPEERGQVQTQTKKHAEIAPLVENGGFYRLCDPFTENACAWAFVSPDKKAAFAVHVGILNVANAPMRRICFRGLDPAADYFVEELGRTFAGDALMAAGLPLAPQHGDFAALTFTLTAQGQ